MLDSPVIHICLFYFPEIRRITNIGHSSLDMNQHFTLPSRSHPFILFLLMKPKSDLYLQLLFVTCEPTFTILTYFYFYMVQRMQLCRSQTISRLRKFTIINTVILTYIDIPMSCLYMPLFHALIFTCIDYLFVFTVLQYLSI